MGESRTGSATRSTQKRRRAWFWAFVVIAVLNPFFLRAFWPVGRTAPTYSRETTYLTGPVNDDGTVNYAEALDAELAEGVTPETNGAVAFVRLFGPSVLRGDSAPKALARLGLGDLPAEGEYLRPLRAFLTEWVASHPTPEEQALPEHTEHSRARDDVAKRLMKGESIDVGEMELLDVGTTRRKATSTRLGRLYDRVTSGPWSAEEFPFLADYLDEHETDLARIAEQSRCLRWYVPIVSAHSPSWPTGRRSRGWRSRERQICSVPERCVL